MDVGYNTQGNWRGPSINSAWYDPDELGGFGFDTILVPASTYDDCWSLLDNVKNPDLVLGNGSPQDPEVMKWWEWEGRVETQLWNGGWYQLCWCPKSGVTGVSWDVGSAFKKVESVTCLCKWSGEDGSSAKAKYS